MTLEAPREPFERWREPVPLWRIASVYVALVVAPLVGLLAILHAGAGLSPLHIIPAVSGDVIPASEIVLRMPIFLAQILVILAVSRAMGRVLKTLGQPRVVGEMLAGLMLGPSLLGWAMPATYAWLFPFGTVRFLNALSQFGLVLFMFVVGLEIDLHHVSSRRYEAMLTSHAGIALPMFAGGAAALFLYPRFSAGDTSFVIFAMFLACAMSITAFPVLARILDERKLTLTPIGTETLTCAALADVSAWIVLAFVLAMARSSVSTATAALPLLLGGAVLYLIVMIAVVGRFLAYFCITRHPVTRHGGKSVGTNEIGQDELAVILAIVLLSALATEFLQIHAIFGAFVAGAVMPRELRNAIRSRLDDVLTVVLLPLFFAYAGLRANVGALTATADWLACGAIIALAIAGKVGGSLLGTRATGMSWREATAVGVLMNARGLMELVLLTIGLQEGFITPALFTIMVIMAVVTTIMTSPALSYVLRR